MGLDVATPASAQAVYQSMRAEQANAIVAPCSVVELDFMPRHRMIIARPAGWTGSIRGTMVLTYESGDVLRIDVAGFGERSLALELPGCDKLGYHEIEIELCHGTQTRSDHHTLVVVPPSCIRPMDVLGGRRVAGLTCNLYAVRSTRNWGVGDVTDLGTLLRFCRHCDFDFIGLNPLHALRNRGIDISPYAPQSRLFRNLLYIDVEAVPELATCAEAQHMLASDEVQRALSQLRCSSHVQYDQIIELKHCILRLLHKSFLREHTAFHAQRYLSYQSYLHECGPTLGDFARFCALHDHVVDADGKSLTSWQDWPAQLRNPRSAAVDVFAQEHAETVDYHRFLQFELDRQLARAAKLVDAYGLAIGVYQDLAIGCARNSFDTWRSPEIFLHGIDLGAPPDDYSATGQNWGLPAVDPHMLRRQAYRPWVELLRASLRHAKALRIDHVLGLFRQFWIPAGCSGTEGAYVRFPVDDLLGILALESVRATALIVGEDLGTVSEDVPGAMKKWGLLSSRVLYFERTADGSFAPAASYDENTFVSANTHDMATLSGFWRGRDIDLKHQLGVITTVQADEARSKRVGERRHLLARLRADGVLASEHQEPTEAELRGAVHDFLRITPAAVAALSLEDLVGEVEPVNVPGIGPERYSSWTRRLHVSLETLRTEPDVALSLGRLRRRDS